MQNLSILQLLKALSAVNANSPEENKEEKQPVVENAAPLQQKKESSPGGERDLNGAERKNLEAYENFLLQHERTVKKIKKEK